VVTAFTRDGYAILPGTYSVPTEVTPIWRGIHAIIGLVAEQSGVSLERSRLASDVDPETLAERFDDGYDELIAHDRALGGIVYDAVKQLAPFVRLTASGAHEAVVAQL